MIHWTAHRKWELIRDFHLGKDIAPVMSQNAISTEELHGWLYLYRHNGIDGLKASKLQECVR